MATKSMTLEQLSAEINKTKSFTKTSGQTAINKIGAFVSGLNKRTFTEQTMIWQMIGYVIVGMVKSGLAADKTIDVDNAKQFGEAYESIAADTELIKDSRFSKSTAVLMAHASMFCTDATLKDWNGTPGNDFRAEKSNDKRKIGPTNTEYYVRFARQGHVKPSNRTNTTTPAFTNVKIDSKVLSTTADEFNANVKAGIDQPLVGPVWLSDLARMSDAELDALIVKINAERKRRTFTNTKNKSVEQWAGGVIPNAHGNGAPSNVPNNVTPIVPAPNDDDMVAIIAKMRAAGLTVTA